MSRQTLPAIREFLDKQQIEIIGPDQLLKDGQPYNPQQLVHEFPNCTYTSLLQDIGTIWIAKSKSVAPPVGSNANNIDITKAYMSNHGFYFAGDTIRRNYGGYDRAVTVADVLVYLANDAASASQQGLRGITKQSFSDAINLMMAVNKDEEFRQLLSSTKYDPVAPIDPDVYVKCLYDTVGVMESYDVFRTMFLHHIWLIKRKLHQLPTKNDIMIAWKGEEGIGKGYLIYALYTRVLGQQAAQIQSLEEALDSRAHRILAKYLINMDELGITSGGKARYSSGSDMAKFKSLVTASQTTNRELGTNIISDSPVNVVWMSTANQSIREIFNDSNGMRRFIEFTSNHGRMQRFEDAPTQWLLDHASYVFRSVNETDHHGYFHSGCSCYNEILALQDSYITLPSYGIFINDCLIPRVGQPNWTKVSVLYGWYQDWANSQGYKPDIQARQVTFAKALAARWGKTSYCRERSNTVEYYLDHVSP